MSIVALREFAVHLTTPLSTAAGDIEARKGLLVRVDVGGTPGVGEATPLPGWTESVDDCHAALERARDDGTLPGPEAPAARHAVTLAYRDAVARRSDRSVAATLARDDSPAASVPVNATVGDASVAETVDAAWTAVEDGYRTLKLKVGVGSVERDVARVEAVAAAVADADTPVTLRADANGAWNTEEAREALAALDGLVEYVEQPLSASDLAGHAALRGVGAPVALDESLTAYCVGEVLDTEACDAVVLKPMALGGPSQALAAGRAAAHAGVTPVVTTTIDAAVARTAAVHVAAAMPGGEDRAHGLGTGDLLAGDVVDDDPVPVEDGRIAVPTEPGLAGGEFVDLV